MYAAETRPDTLKTLQMKKYTRKNTTSP